MATSPTRTETALALTIADIEAKRAHMHRMLVDNRELLADAVHALSEGNVLVTAEFLDRMLTAVDAEIAYQRDA